MINISRRIMGFKSHDWKHLWFLFKNMHIQLFKGDLLEAYDAWMWIRVHLSYDSTYVPNEEE